MINDIIIKAIDILQMLINLTNIDTIIEKIIELFTTFSNYQSYFTETLSWLYFFINKPVLVTCIVIGAIMIIARIVFAIVNLIYP